MAEFWMLSIIISKWTGCVLAVDQNRLVNEKKQSSEKLRKDIGKGAVYHSNVHSFRKIRS